MKSLTRILEWGPSSHDPENPFSVENTVDAALSHAFGADGDARPDDN
ncbi:MAG: hypothetical protein QM572_11650 [Nocardioides sp.]